jgi:hypothetical protein
MSEKIEVTVLQLPSVFDDEKEKDNDDDPFVSQPDHHPVPSTGFNSPPSHPSTIAAIAPLQ